MAYSSFNLSVVGDLTDQDYNDLSEVGSRDLVIHTITTCRADGRLHHKWKDLGKHFRDEYGDDGKIAMMSKRDAIKGVILLALDKVEQRAYRLTKAQYAKSAMLKEHHKQAVSRVNELWSRVLRYAYGDGKAKIASSIAKEETGEAEAALLSAQASDAITVAEAAKAFAEEEKKEKKETYGDDEAEEAEEVDAMDEDDGESVMSNFSTEKAAKKKKRQDASILAAAKAFEEGAADGESFETIIINDMRAAVVAIREQAADVGGRVVDVNNYRHIGDGSTAIKTDVYNGVVNLISNIYNSFDDEGNVIAK